MSEQKQINSEKEKWFAHIALAAAVVACAAIAPWDQFFLPNFLYFVVPSVVVWVIGLIFKVRPVITTGAILGFAAFVVLFYLALEIYGGDSMAWLLYVFSLPGGLIAYIAVAFVAAKRLSHVPTIPAFFLSLAALVVGLFVSYLVVLFIA